MSEKNRGTFGGRLVGARGPLQHILDGVSLTVLLGGLVGRGLIGCLPLERHFRSADQHNITQATGGWSKADALSSLPGRLKECAEGGTENSWAPSAVRRRLLVCGGLLRAFKPDTGRLNFAVCRAPAYETSAALMNFGGELNRKSGGLAKSIPRLVPALVAFFSCGRRW